MERHDSARRSRRRRPSGHDAADHQRVVEHIAEWGTRLVLDQSEGPEVVTTLRLAGVDPTADLGRLVHAAIAEALEDQELFIVQKQEAGPLELDERFAVDVTVSIRRPYDVHDDEDEE